MGIQSLCLKTEYEAENEFLKHNPIDPLQIYYGRFVLWGSKNHTYCLLKGIVGASDESVHFVVSWKSFLSIQKISMSLAEMEARMFFR